ncbi:glycosyltransferase family 4 protein [Haloquadratum walsbyi]|jgi:Glycosyltransferase|uniref:Glycosyltransferase n=1 Tax=Haloquadratum walsbyi J07HQW2 TaxID=1238425 RepID=U1MYX1_9EURY|nr:glycosyltransferase family 4 protein [Haloquadratum walsbyi]ERG95714.1 MAG: glycosyltransferase [Haloquadratum walsbyi J07HQW2]
MRIAFVYDAVFPYEKGGAQKRIWELARRLATDHDVHLYGMHYWDGPTTIEREGVTLHGVCEPIELYTEGRRSILQALYFALWLIPALLTKEFDIIDCQEFPYFPCFVAKANSLITGATLVITWYEVWDKYWYEYLGLKGVFGQLIERFTTRLPARIIPISSFIADDLRAIGTTKPLTVVENGVDFDNLQSIPASDTSWDLLFVGRLSEHKRVNQLIAAIPEIERQIQTSLTIGIIGDGPEREELETQAETLDIESEITFLGFVDADRDVIAHLKAASVFVLPSIREGFPNTILEANACGTPAVVVSHPENGSTAVVDDGQNGIHHRPNS